METEMLCCAAACSEATMQWEKRGLAAADHVELACGYRIGGRNSFGAPTVTSA